MRNHFRLYISLLPLFLPYLGHITAQRRPDDHQMNQAGAPRSLTARYEQPGRERMLPQRPPNVDTAVDSHLHSQPHPYVMHQAPQRLDTNPFQNRVACLQPFPL